MKEGSIRFPLFFVERPLSHVDLCSKFRGLRRLLPFSYLLISQPPPPEGRGANTTREILFNFYTTNNLRIPFEVRACGLGKSLDYYDCMLALVSYPKIEIWLLFDNDAVDLGLFPQSFTSLNI